MLKLENTLANFLHWQYISQKCDLGQQFNLMIRLQNFLKTSLQDVLKRLEDVSNRYGQDEYIGLHQDVLRRSSEDV